MEEDQNHQTQTPTSPPRPNALKEIMNQLGLDGPLSLNRSLYSNPSSTAEWLILRKTRQSRFESCSKNSVPLNRRSRSRRRQRQIQASLVSGGGGGGGEGGGIQYQDAAYNAAAGQGFFPMLQSLPPLAGGSSSSSSSSNSSSSSRMGGGGVVVVEMRSIRFLVKLLFSRD
ncbi:hypothetical protein OSB04_019903 [Centaurea solstitialis]|uniref:Uncharacterized protein n=1 Tax=Centaurea solstitialis TaxID=347529 RepID=A0AA38T3F1_9ASTR|nr:hypothetical protein OSB04_019903 [Centaurea solstitialis]